MRAENYKYEVSSNVMSKFYRNWLALQLGKCPYCPWHGGENGPRNMQRNWKKFRKNQYKIIDK